MNKAIKQGDNLMAFINPIPKIQKELTSPFTLPLVNRLKTEARATNTIRGYTSTIERLIRYYDYSAPTEIDVNKILGFLVYLNETRKINWRSMKHHVASIRYYWREILLLPEVANRIPYPKEKPSLPKILSRKEIQAIFNGCANLKHRTILRLVYSSGLRRCEVLKLRIEDIESDDGKMRIRINNSKGGKDRYTVLSPIVLEELRVYYLKYKPEIYLFNGHTKGEPFSPGGLRHALKNAIIKSGVKKPVNFHVLRHCFATHSIEHGMHIKMLQGLMGHSDLRTTLIYLEVSEVSWYEPFSPLDRWDGE